MTIIIFGIFILLGTVAYQDFRNRAIWWFLPPLVFIAGLLLNYSEIPILTMTYSTAFISGTLLFLVLYVKLRFGNMKLFQDYFGLGDALMLFSLVPFFEFRTYILFFTIATIGSLVLHLLVSLFKKQSTIPYAGYVSLIFGSYIGLNHFLKFNLTELLHV